MDKFKNVAVWGMVGTIGGGLVAAAFNSNQISVADHWGSIVAVIATGLAAAATAFVTALKKKNTP